MKAWLSKYVFISKYKNCKGRNFILPIIDKSLHPIKYYRDHLSHEIRPDGRELDKFRPVIINAGSISSADGSAIAKVGRTTVICGIKAEFCIPKADKPNEGFMIPNLELMPLCSSKFKPGPPSEAAQAATKIIADIIENSGCIDLKDLCIAREKLAWCLYADMVCLDYDGSVVDACLLALLTALKTVTLPTVEYDPAIDNKLVNLEERKPLTIHSTPVSTTFAIFDNLILIDPTVEEETLCTGIITVVVKDDELCSVLKPGGAPVTKDKMLECVKHSIKRAKLLETLMKSATEESKDELNVNLK